MRLLNKNKQEMKFSSKGNPEPIYVTDENGNKVIEYITEEGEPIYKETGEYTSGWSAPVIFYGNIAQSGGEAEAREFGLSVADYDAVVLLDKDEVPLKEGDAVWHKSPVLYPNGEEHGLDGKSADYTVVRVSESLNFVKIILKAVIK